MSGLDLVFETEHGPGDLHTLMIQWPCDPLPATTNMRGHWRIAKHTSAARKSVADLFGYFGPRAKGFGDRAEDVVMTFTRIAPRKLDDDNLRSAFKAVRDEVVEQLGLPDDSERAGIRFLYNQSKPDRTGATGARVVIAWKDPR